MTENSQDQQLDVLVVGAGFAGVYATYRFRHQGLTMKCVEEASDVGGVWYHNRYPGARCDVRSIDYSYSFSDEVQQEWRWSERFAAQPEIQRYIAYVTDKFDLRRDIIFNSRVKSARWNDETKRWTTTTSRGDTFVSRFLILCTGGLSEPKPLDFPGLENFQGERYTTSRWPKQQVEFAGKRVGVIGTGSSGVQSIPIIAEAADHLTVFQRTGVFAMPSRNGPIDEEEYDAIRTRYADYRKEVKAGFAGLIVAPISKSLADFADDAEKDEVFEERWIWGSLAPASTFNDFLINQEANDETVRLFREKIRKIVKDPATAADLCTQDYPIGARRACLDNGYYETFNRPDVKLVNLREDPIVEFTAKGIRTRSREHELDMVVFATGFDALTGSVVSIDIRNGKGESVADRWTDGAKTYLGMMVEGFPNFFIVNGPGAPGLFVNVVLAAEQHLDFMGDLIAWLDRKGYQTVEPHHDHVEQWFAHVAEVANQTLYVKANSWAMGANIEGKPRGFLAYLGGMGNYNEICEKIAAGEYQEFIKA